MNPFEAYGIDPREGPRAITERFRELLEDAASDEEKEALRAAWEALTLHPMRRIRAAFGAHPAHPSGGDVSRTDAPPKRPDFPAPFRQDPILFPVASKPQPEST